jgi:hypothetical protein
MAHLLQRQSRSVPIWRMAMNLRLAALAVLCCVVLSRSGQPVHLFAQTGAPQTSVQETNDRVVQQILKTLAGQEGKPAEQVFKNIQIQWLKGIPAQQFLTIMNVGYSQALGVTCTHCHVETDFSSDAKRPKRAAREMAVMHRSINQQLAKMENLATPATENRSINCATCHRGAVNPR